MQLALPLAALALGGAAVLWKEWRIARLERDIATLEKAASTSRSPRVVAAEPKRAALPKDSEGAVDWQKAAEALGSFRGLTPAELRSSVRMSARIEEMEVAELEQALNEVEDADLKRIERTMLELELARSLAKKDPEMLLTRFGRRLLSTNVSYFLTPALESWAGSDPEAAAAWLDSEIAAGTLDEKRLQSRNSIRGHFETSLIAVLQAKSPAAAEQRLAGLPPEVADEVKRGLARPAERSDPSEE